MDYDEQDHEIISLLSKLRDTEGNYPVEMMAARRQSFVKQIAALGIGAGAAIVMKEGSKAAGGSSIPPIAGTILETALIVAIVAEASFVAFVNREKVLDVFRTISGQSTVEQVIAPVDVSPPQLEPTGFVETAFTETAEPTLVTETLTAVETPSPQILLVTQSASESQDSGSPEAAGAQVNSTPEPNGNNGNHYGQTPIPERTKETGGGGSGSNSSNDTNNNNNNNNNGNGNRNNH